MSPFPQLQLLPPSVRSAELLRGTLVHCGVGERPISWPDSPETRARSLNDLVSVTPSLAVVLHTAAWVWGATWRVHEPVSLSTFRRARLLHPRKGTRVHEFDLQEAHVTRFAHIPVTTPARTLYDLLFIDDTDWVPATWVNCVMLLRLITGDPSSIIDELCLGRRPHLNRARKRLRFVCDYAVTR